MSDSSTHNKSNRIWKVSDVIDSSMIQSFDGGYIDFEEDYDQQQQQPQKISSRRRSERLSLKRSANEKSNAEQSESNGPPKKKKKTKEPMAEKSVQTTACSASILNVDYTNVLKTKNELSKAIYDLFEEYQQDKKHANKFSAKCTLCDETDDARLSFTKGINSNLKTHLTRVSKPYFCFHLFGLLFKVNWIIVWQTILSFVAVNRLIQKFTSALKQKQNTKKQKKYVRAMNPNWAQTWLIMYPLTARC